MLGQQHLAIVMWVPWTLVMKVLLSPPGLAIVG